MMGKSFSASLRAGRMVNPILILFVSSFLFSCQSPDQAKQDPPNGFRPYYVGDSLLFEYHADSTTWTRKVAAIRDTLLNDTPYVFFSILDSSDSAGSEKIDSLGEGYLRYSSGFFSPVDPSPIKPCNMLAWYPGKNSWQSGEGKKFHFGGTDFTMRVESCSYGGYDKIMSTHIDMLNYVDSELGTVFKIATCTSAGPYCDAGRIEIGLTGKNGKTFDYQKIVQAYKSAP